MIQALLFDLDGVLVDSWDSTIDYFCETLEYFKYPIRNRKDFLPLRGSKSIDWVRKLLPDSTEEEEIQKVYEYSKTMSVKYVPKVKLIGDAIPVLKSLRKKYKTAIITSRGKITATMLLKRFKLNQYFDVTIDRDDIQNHKPHPEGIHTAMERLNVKNAVYIGDAREDVEAAKNAGIKSILISTEKEDFGSDFKIPNIAKLKALIVKIESFS